jgi:hypothetical protein
MLTIDSGNGQAGGNRQLSKGFMTRESCKLNKCWYIFIDILFSIYC